MTDKTKPDELNLVQKVAAIMGDMTGFAKTGKNSGMGYKFLEVNEILIDVRPRFAAHGIILFPTDIDVEQINFHERGNGGFSTHVFINVKWELTDGNESRILDSVGEAIDTSDKAMNKAQTAAEKQVLQKLLLISNEEDNDQNHYEHQYQAPQPDPLAEIKAEAFGLVDKLAKMKMVEPADVIYSLTVDGRLPATFSDAKSITTREQFQQIISVVQPLIDETPE